MASLVHRLARFAHFTVTFRYNAKEFSLVALFHKLPNFDYYIYALSIYLYLSPSWHLHVQS